MRTKDRRTKVPSEPNPMWKIDYLSSQLSHRTRRKDLENYVVNAIYNRIGDLGLKPVAQQLIRTNEGSKFIDLYFPQVKVAIECDEPHHSTVEQTRRDEIREISIFDALRSVGEEELTDFIRVRYNDFNDSNSFDMRLTEIATRIKRDVARLRMSGDFEEWVERSPDPITYFADRDWIDLAETVLDEVGFTVIADVHNALFGSNFSAGAGQGLRSYYNLARYSPSYEGIHMSFCKLNVEGGSGAQGWRNTLSLDGIELREAKNDSSPGDFIEPAEGPRVWFVKDTRPVKGGNTDYRYAGIFEARGNPEDYRIWHRIGTKLRIVPQGTSGIQPITGPAFV